MSNPLLSSFTGPFNTAPFPEILTAHFQPAFIAAIEEAKKEIEAIKLESLPTFENTVEALEKSGKHLGILSALFFNLNSAETNAELQGLVDRRNPGEPIILVLYGPWHFFFALFLEMVIHVVVESQL
jgi:peptidyl-dipeptidase Dcp